MRTPIATDHTPGATRCDCRRTCHPPRACRVVALFGPPAWARPRSRSRSPSGCARSEGEDPSRSRPTRCSSTPGWRSSPAPPTPAERARLEHRLLGVLPVTRARTAGDYARRAHAEIDALIAAGRRPIVVGGTGLYLRAALAELDLRPPPPTRAAGALARRLADAAAALHAELAPRATRRRRGDRARPTPSGSSARSSCSTRGAAAGGDQLWTAETRHPTLLVALDDGARGALPPHRRARRRDGRRRSREEVRRADAAGASPSARQALGFEELLRGDVEAMRAAPAATPSASSRGCASCRARARSTYRPDAEARRPPTEAADARSRGGHARGRCGSRSGRRSATTT